MSPSHDGFEHFLILPLRSILIDFAWSTDPDKMSPHVRACLASLN